MQSVVSCSKEERGEEEEEEEKRENGGTARLHKSGRAEGDTVCCGLFVSPLPP